MVIAVMIAGILGGIIAGILGFNAGMNYCIEECAKREIEIEKEAYAKGEKTANQKLENITRKMQEQLTDSQNETKALAGKLYGVNQQLKQKDDKIDDLKHENKNWENVVFDLEKKLQKSYNEITDLKTQGAFLQEELNKSNEVEKDLRNLLAKKEVDVKQFYEQGRLITMQNIIRSIRQYDPDLYESAIDE